MSRGGKIALGVIGGLVGIIALLVVLLIVFFPTDRATDFAIERIEAATGRDVTVRSARLKLLPHIRLDLEGVAFGEQPEPGRPRVTLKHLGLRMNPTALLGRRLEVIEVLLDSPRVEMILAEVPENTADAGGERATAPDPAEATRPVEGGGSGEATAATADASTRTPPSGRRADAPPTDTAVGITIDVQHFELRGGEVVVDYPDGRPFARLSGLAENLQASATADGDLALSGTTELGMLALHLPTGHFGDGLSLTLTKDLRYDASADELVLTDATLLVAGMPIRLTGRVGGVQSSAMMADLRLEGGPGQVDEILGLIPANLFPQMEGMTSTGTLTVSGDVRGKLTAPMGPHFDLNLRLTDGNVQYPGVPRSIDDIDVEVHATPDTLRVPTFAVRTASSTLEGTALVSDYRATPQIQADLTTTLDLEEMPFYYPPAETLGLGGTIAGRVAIRGNAAEPEALAIEGDIRADGVKTQTPQMPVPLHAVTGRLEFDTDTVILDALSGRLGSSDFDISGRLDHPMSLDPNRTGGERANATVTIRSALLNIDEMRPPDPESGSGSGEVGGASTAGGQGRRGLPLIPPMDATVTLHADRMVVNRIDARNVHGELDLAEGRLTLNRFTTEVFGGDLAMTGHMTVDDPAAPRFDMDVVVQDCQVSELFAHNEKLARFSTAARALTGKLSGRSEMQGTLNDTLALDPMSLLSVGAVEITEASLRDHPVQKELATYLNTPGLNLVAIESLLQPFRIENGRMTFEGLALKASDFEAMGGGWSAIDGTYGMTLDLWLPKAWAQPIRQELPAPAAEILFGADVDRLLVPVAVSGQGPGRPSIRLDTDRLTKQAESRLQEEVEKKQEELAEEARQRALEAAADLLGEGADTDSTSLEELKEDVEETVRGALENIFGKKKKKK